MLIAFFDSKSVVHHKFAPQGYTVASTFYLDVLKRLKVKVNRLMPASPVIARFVMVMYLATLALGSRITRFERHPNVSLVLQFRSDDG
ncbi:hypothetical protein NPIL_226601 [Nephila pilipes]|uniref:Uncharacterized protein n=1 Tax=Nephila pilipes TaxID=299642 RepID=A0A8X6N9U0_NEPPI|nr:hypothetical protein NPIL_226601 [Nephila pilipes]